MQDFTTEGFDINMAILQAQGISKSYFARDVLSGVDLTLNEGERFALIGDNGTGKSTFLKIIAGVEEADVGRISIASTITVSYLSQQMEEFENLEATVLNTDFLDALQSQLEVISKKIQEASPENEKRLLHEYQSIQDKFEQRGGYAYRSNLAQALAALGIHGEKLHRPIRTLSGGERMRVLMARRILENADLLLLDEPTNHLDIEGLEWLEHYLRNYKGSILLISHDRYFIDKVCNRTGELAGGKLFVYKGNYSDYQEQKKNRTELLTKSIASLEEDLERQKEITQTLLSHRKMTSYHAREKVVAKLEDEIEEVRALLPQTSRRMNFHFISNDKKMDNERLLVRLENANMSWDEENYLFKNLNLEILANSKKVILGPNGSGKSTLLQILMGKIQSFSGDLFAVPELSVGHLGQYTEFEDESLSILEEFVSRTHALETDARNTLAKFAFTGIEVYKTISVLSGGERARLYLCCLLEEKPDLLYLDEPTNHLDIHSREVLEDAIIDFDGAVIAVSHDRYFIEKCGFEILGFVNHQVKEYVNYNSYRHFAALATALPENTVSDVKKTTKKRFNIGKLTKELKALNRQVRVLEQRIHETEVEIEMFEDKLHNAEDAEYAAYANKTSELEAMYQEFFTLSEKVEELNAQIDANK